MSRPRILVIGAGIGGLTTALSLYAAGISCVVVDSVRKLAPAGVGINLQPHAVRELVELGLGDELAAIAVPTAEMIHFDRHGNRIWGEPRGTAAGYRWPQYSVHRGRLQMMLLAAVHTRLGPDAVRTGLAFEGFRQDAEQVTVRLWNRAAGTSVDHLAEAVVGADGLRSTVRARTHPGEGPPLRTTIRMWRGTAERKPFLTGRSMIMAGHNGAAKFVAYPISPPRPDGLVTVNWVAEVRQDDDGLAVDWTAGGRLADVLPYFRDWRFDWLDIPALMADTESILEYPMVDRDPLPSWTVGRLTLLGDAAHPMYPIGSNGGSQAIIDARVLAYHLATAGDVRTALKRYEEDRRETTAAFVLANRTLGPERILRTVAERAPHGFTRIEDVLSAEELAMIGGSYRETTGSDAQALNDRPSWSAPRRPAVIDHRAARYSRDTTARGGAVR